jgi:hypothetical protein
VFTIAPGRGRLELDADRGDAGPFASTTFRRASTSAEDDVADLDDRKRLSSRTEIDDRRREPSLRAKSACGRSVGGSDLEATVGAVRDERSLRSGDRPSGSLPVASAATYAPSTGSPGARHDAPAAILRATSSEVGAHGLAVLHGDSRSRLPVAFRAGRDLLVSRGRGSRERIMPAASVLAILWRK